jgi:type II secretory pathway predicted ATPase ExeA
MYLFHYNLAEKPFEINTDPKFLWLGEKHKEALAILEYGVVSHKGFLLLTGEVGTGKTTLINALLKGLYDDTIVANVKDPKLDVIGFFNLISRLFKIRQIFDHKEHFILHFSKVLRRAHLNNKRFLLIIDEAHTLSKELLEQIRLLSNIELPEKKLINIFLVGQPELNRLLLSPECRALRQRIVLAYHIKPLEKNETREYIRHRLRVARAKTELFSRNAMDEIHRLSNGYPRLINILCDQALWTGYLREMKSITPAVIRECSEELLLPGETERKVISGRLGHHSGEKKSSKHFKEIIARLNQQRLLYGALAASVVIIAVLITLLAQKDLFSRSDQRRLAPSALTPLSSSRSESNLPHTQPKVAARTQFRNPIVMPPPGNSETPKPTLAELAQKALAGKDFARAVELLENTGAHKPTDMPKVKLLYVQALRGQADTLSVKDPQEEELLLHKAIQADPQDARTYFDLGKIYTKSKDYPKAIKAYEKAADLNPNSPDTFFNLGFVHAASKDYESAEQTLLRVTELQPNYLDKALFNLAFVQQKQGKRQQCIDNLEKALTVNPSNQKVRKYLNQIQGNARQPS